MEKYIEQFAKIPGQQKVAGLVAVLVLLSAGLYFGLINESLTRQDANIETIAAQQVELNRLREMTKSLKKFQQEVKRLKDRLRKAEEQLPKKAEVPKLLRDISYEANQSGLLVERFEIRPERKDGDFARVPVEMRVSGNYHEIAVFLDRLAKMPRIVNVSNLSMTQPIKKNKKTVLTSSFEATTFRFLDKSLQEKDDKKKKKGKKSGLSVR